MPARWNCTDKPWTRRARLRSAEGNTAGALWGLLIAGAFVLFAFHGMFVTHAWAVWAVLLLGFSFVLGLAFYLIFSLDSPFTGKLSAGPPLATSPSVPVLISG